MEHFVLGSIFWRAFFGEHLAGSIFLEEHYDEEHFDGEHFVLGSILFWGAFFGEHFTGSI